jgi:hypothetical protein
MFLFSFIGEIKPVLKTSVVILILCISSVTLVYGRKYYELFYNQGIHKIISEINNAKQQFGNDSVDAAIEVENYFVDYYNKNFPLDKNSKYVALSNGSNMHDFIKTVSESKKNYFAFASVRGYPLECVQILKEYFPYVISEYKGHLTEIFICSKTRVPSAQADEVIFSSENNFAAQQNGWNFDKLRIIDDTVPGIFAYKPSDEFGVEFKKPLGELVNDRNNLLYVKAQANLTDTAAPLLVMAMESFDKTVDWRAAKFSDYLKPEERGNVYLALRFSDVRIDTKNTTLKVYVWNKDHADFILFNMKVSSEKGNPYFYGLFEEF